MWDCLIFRVNEMEGGSFGLVGHSVCCCEYLPPTLPHTHLTRTSVARTQDWMQNLPTDTVAATTKWGDIGDWDTSGVGDFSYAFSTHRKKDGSYVNNGNPNAATFVGIAISKWDTASATSLRSTFWGASVMNADLFGWKVAKVVTLQGTFSFASKFTGTGLSAWDTASATSLYLTFSRASVMNADLSGWKVAKVVTLQGTFSFASKFTGTGLSAWDVAKVTTMSSTFYSTTSLTTCNKRLIADTWKSNSAFATYDTAWTSDTCVGVQQTDAQFKEASWDWVQNLPTDTVAATTKWGDIGDWDTSGVGDFSYAFSIHRNQGGSYGNIGNPKAATFVGTAISKWDTASATTLHYTFGGASEMNADLSGWKVGKVVTLRNTFSFASKFTGTGVDTWDVAKVTTMTQTFFSTTSLTTCNKRLIADTWKSSSVFVATTYVTDWAGDTCPVRFECLDEYG